MTSTPSLKTDINPMYHHAISNRNLALLGTIGLISVLREGVEVIIFYMGMMGSIKTLDFVIGIILANNAKFRLLIAW
jgi:high-affinity iron transporter